MKEGEQIILFDGGPAEIIYTIAAITKKNISLRGNEQKMPHTEPKKQIYLYQALPNKIEKIEYILQKGVEVGIAKFVFFRSQYSQKFLLSDAKKHRLETIAREALEQCGGLVMPEIVFLEEISLESCDYPQLVLDTTGNMSSLHEVNMHSKIALWVGPEGGWSESEIIKMQEKGYVFARF
jgi:16S rRNA (uracil1498-N3)-methyltransferase